MLISHTLGVGKRQVKVDRTARRQRKADRKSTNSSFNSSAEVYSEMIEFKACSRCKGDVKTNQDIYGPYRQCLQCGRMQDVKVVADKREAVGSKNRAA